MKPGWEWTFLRGVITLWFVVQVIYCSIPDYPWGTRLWEAVFYGTAGWIHEMGILLLIWLGAIDLSFHIEARTRRVQRMRILKKVPT